MADFYYLYDPADNLALGQAIHLANTDGGMSYIIPFANKSGTVDTNDPASAGLGVIESAIALGPLHAGSGNDPIANRLTPAQFQGRVSPDQWNAIKAMVSASIAQAPPAGWNNASLEAAGTTYSVISADGYRRTNELKTHVFTGGAWRDADTTPAISDDDGRGNPFIAFGGRIEEAVFVDYSGHYIKTPTFIGQQVITSTGINTGNLYEGADLVAYDDKGDPVYGLSINAPGKDVTLVNFSATSMGLGRITNVTDDLGFTSDSADPLYSSYGQALRIYGGNVTIGGDLVIDQFTQVIDGTKPLTSAIEVSGAESRVTINGARLLLGAVRGFESVLEVTENGSLQIKDSTIYGFSSSNSNSPRLPQAGLNWEGFESTRGSNAIAHLIMATDGGLLQLENTTLLREERRQASGDYSIIFNPDVSQPTSRIAG
jgi:hypothetical protein